MIPTGRQRVSNKNRRRDPERAIFELSNRIDQWITVHPDGAILVIERQDGRWTESHALPKSAPWTVRCMPNGIRVTVSNLFEGDPGATGAVISKKLTRAKFTDEHCAQILPALPRKLQHIFSCPIRQQTRAAMRQGQSRAQR